MSSLIQDWRELRRAWKQFAAALLSISAEDLARPERREVTRLAEAEKAECVRKHIAMLNELSEAAMTRARAGGLAEIARAAEIVRSNSMRIEELALLLEHDGVAN